MDLDKDDFAVLCKGMTKDEVDRIHRLVHEWSIGPENSFPVQLALLTGAQFRAAASIPRSIADSRKWLELHLSQYRQQTASSTLEFASMVDKKHGDLKDIVLQHAESVKRDELFVRSRLTDVNEVAKGIQKNLFTAVTEWNYAKDTLAQERQKFEKACQQLNDAVNLRGVHWYIIGSLAACVMTLLIGHYVWHH